MRIFLLATISAVALSTAAYAADAVIEEVPAAPAAVVSAYDWTGFYIGGFGGVTTGDTDFGAGSLGGPSIGTLSVSASGGLAGGQIGYDWQTGKFVFGAVADIAWTNHEASLDLDDSFGELASVSSELKYLGTVRARAGYAAWDRALLYAHGGFAYGETDQDISILGDNIFSDSTSKSGWTIGAGFEYAFTEQLSFQTEYGYVDLGTDTVFAGDPGLGIGDVFVDEDLKFHQIKAALNFRF